MEQQSKCMNEGGTEWVLVMASEQFFSLIMVRISYFLTRW